MSAAKIGHQPDPASSLPRGLSRCKACDCLLIPVTLLAAPLLCGKQQCLTPTCAGGGHRADCQQPAERAGRRHTARQPRARRHCRWQQGVWEGRAPPRLLCHFQAMPFGLGRHSCKNAYCASCRAPHQPKVKQHELEDALTGTADVLHWTHEEAKTAPCLARMLAAYLAGSVKDAGHAEPGALSQQRYLPLKPLHCCEDPEP